MSKLKIAVRMVVRTIAIGMMSGCLLGLLFGLKFLFMSLLVAIFGLYFGLGLGLLEGLLLSFISCVFFYPPHSTRIYRMLMRVAGGIIPFVVVGGFFPWYFSPRSMTPGMAVTIGSHSVLASFIAGWAGILAAENIASWYLMLFRSPNRDELTRKEIPSAANFFQPVLEWVYIALFALLCTGFGELFLSFTICGTADLRDCLLRPRLYTSMIEGYKVMFPTMAIVFLAIAGLRSLSRKFRP